MLKEWRARAADEHYILFFLLGYRWLSLLPPFLALLLAPRDNALLLPVFLFALADNLFLSLLHPRVNQWLIRLPALIGIDIVLVALFLSLTGGDTSLFYLYALSPVLAAALFFRMRGALAATCGLALTYALLLGLLAVPLDVLHALTQFISFFLIAVLFGYSAILIEHIRNDRALLAKSNATLERTNREITSIHNLALQMQSSAVDVPDIEQVILTTITNSMGFERAMLALVDPDRNALIGWLSHQQHNGESMSAGISHTMEIPLSAASGVVAQVVLKREAAYVMDGLPPTDDPGMNRRLALRQYAALPLYMRDNPIGVLLVDNPVSGTPITSESMHSLKLVADQAAIALGSTRLCIERAQRLAIEEERNRIAMEIHDTATQSLFGIVYTLDGCIKRMDEDPQQVRSTLVDLRAIASRTMNDLRRSVYDIWAGTLSEAEFRAELEGYLQKLGIPSRLAVLIQVEGSLAGVDLSVRRNLLRIAEEGLANVVKHSSATRASITLDLKRQPGCLVVEDNGSGFATPDEGSPVGLVSIRERASAMGAEVRVESRPGSGTRIQIDLPQPPLPTELEPNANSPGR